jgi:hypothetical protein
VKPTMMIWVAVAVLVVGSCNGQNPSDSQQAKCKIRFAVFQSNPHIPGGIATGMSKEQGKWYAKNKNKYPAVCEDGESPNYFIVWSSRFASEGSPEPVINFAELLGTASSSSVSSPVESEYVYLSIFRTTDVQRAQQESSYKPIPVYHTQQDSWWTYRKSHHKSMEDAMKFLAEAANK